MNQKEISSYEALNKKERHSDSNFFVSKTYEEMTPHGSLEFPIASYTVDLNQCILRRTPLHWHKEIQFVFVKCGSMSVKVEENIYEISKGDGIFINSECLHFSFSNESTDCIYVAINISPSFFANSKSLIYEKYLDYFFYSSEIKAIILEANKGWQRIILKNILYINSLLSNCPFGFELETYSIAHNLIYLLIRNNKDIFSSCAKKTSVRNINIKNMISYIEKNYKDKITLEGISKSCNISRSECCRQFKRALNMTPFEYLISFRISKSILLLKNTTLSITEVALDVGFSNVSYYIGKFKRETGMTPLKFRNIVD